MGMVVEADLEREAVGAAAAEGGAPPNAAARTRFSWGPKPKLSILSASSSTMKDREPDGVGQWRGGVCWGSVCLGAGGASGRRPARVAPATAAAVAVASVHNHSPRGSTEALPISNCES